MGIRLISRRPGSPYREHNTTRQRYKRFLNYEFSNSNTQMVHRLNFECLAKPRAVWKYEKPCALQRGPETNCLENYIHCELI